MAMVRAAARMAEAELARELLSCRGSEQERQIGSMYVVLESLGRADSLLTIDGRGRRQTLRLSPCHSEILLLLAWTRRGLSGDELAVLLYQEAGSASTLRAELNRLRHLLDDGLLRSRRYRLVAELSADWLAVQADLAVGPVAAALRVYRRPLLPPSTAQGVVRPRRVRRGVAAPVRARQPGSPT
jgi:hypothetical protein